MERRVATFYVSRASFFWNRPSERGNPLAKKRICKGKIGWIRQFGKKKKNNHLIDLEIKNSFLLLSFRLLNWRFMHCLIYSIVFLFLIIKKLRCPLIKYNNLKIVQRLLCFFFFCTTISPNVEDDSIISLIDDDLSDWYLTIYIYIRNTYFSRLTYSCLSLVLLRIYFFVNYKTLTTLLLRFSSDNNKWQNSHNV